jgi:hypothetical protein
MTFGAKHFVDRPETNEATLTDEANPVADVLNLAQDVR